MDVTTLYALVLGAVQGLSEFLPISSSGHLILARAVFGWNAAELGLAFDVACHLGTLGAVLAFFRQDLQAMLGAWSTPLAPDGPAKTARLIVVGTLPVVVVGLAAADALEAHTRGAFVVCVTLAIGGVGLIVADRIGKQARGESSLGYGEALLIGAAQALALVPGVSRSGGTMTIALLLGLRRPSAARFSFLLGIPATAAAIAKEGADLWQTGASAHVLELFAVGIASSAVVGYLTIRYFLRFLADHPLSAFGYYRILVAAGAAIWMSVR